jgi:acyl CoA:acetate/3-ketoacid CoA transferase beta subunit
MSATHVERYEVCAVAIAEAFRDDGEKLVSPIGTLPAIGARLAKLTFAPDLMMSDGVCTLVSNVVGLGDSKAEKITEGWVPFRTIFDIVWSGKRHVMMGATQIDRFGNQNIACIGPWEKPKAQLLGMRGAPGNTINHTTSYWIPQHSPRVFVEKVDVVSGVGYDRAAQLGERTARFHEIRRVVSNLGVFDFQTSDHRMRLASLHPGVNVEEVKKQTGFELVIPEHVPTTRLPTEEERRLIAEVIDPKGYGKKEVSV